MLVTHTGHDLGVVFGGVDRLSIVLCEFYLDHILAQFFFLVLSKRVQVREAFLPQLLLQEIRDLVQLRQLMVPDCVFFLIFCQRLHHFVLFLAGEALLGLDEVV